MNIYAFRKLRSAIGRLHDILLKNSSLKHVPSAYVSGSFRRMERGSCNGRCFILCNGPSVSFQDLSPLAKEVVFCVSQGFLHNQYMQILPDYHCLPQITYEAMKGGRRVVVEYLKAIDRSITSGNIFLSVTERKLVEDNGIFSSRNVIYLNFCGDWGVVEKNKVIDLGGALPGVQSVSIMALFIAMYLGYEEIYLVGADHDSFRTLEYRYPFASIISTSENYTVDSSNKITDVYSELVATVRLWQQYRVLKEVASANSIVISNATHGGALDVFPRVSLDSLFS